MQKLVSLKEIFEGLPKPGKTLEQEIEERAKILNDRLSWCKHEKKAISVLIRQAKNK